MASSNAPSRSSVAFVASSMKLTARQNTRSASGMPGMTPLSYAQHPAAPCTEDQGAAKMAATHAAA
eukprot:11225451-Lingulodinium_polyedra.AAC.1